MDPFLSMIDIRHTIRQHLPFVDRRELSLVCKDFQEPLQRVFRGYMMFGIYIHPQMKYAFMGDFMLWVTTELTMRGECKWNPTYPDTSVVDMKRIDKTTPSNLFKVVYYKGRLRVKNWKVLLERKAIIVNIPPLVPSIFAFGMGEDILNSLWYTLSTQTLLTSILSYKHKGYSLIESNAAAIELGRLMNLAASKHECDKCIKEIGSQCSFKIIEDLMARGIYNLSSFLGN